MNCPPTKDRPKIAKHQKPKRNDIQGIRGIAIVGVVFFHLLPNSIPNGFVGVDVFFVLSGFLMSNILSHENSLDFPTIFSFFTRRFKRIAPIYALVLLVTAITASIIIVPTRIDDFESDLKWALPFAENILHAFKDIDYWNSDSGSPVLLHLWSLGVEIQYYLIVPFVLRGLRAMESKRAKGLYVGGITAASLLLHSLSSDRISFSFLPSRVWQFLVGTAVFELASGSFSMDSSRGEYRRLDEITGDTEDKLDNVERIQPIHRRFRVVIASLLVLAMIAMMAYPSELDKFAVRITGTFLTGILLFIETDSILLCNKLLVYIGDLSYILYLVHWPVIVLYKLRWEIYEMDETSDVLYILLVSLVLSLLLHHSLEYYFISSSSKTAFSFVAAIYTVIIFMIAFGSFLEISKMSFKISDEVLEAINWNKEQRQFYRINYDESLIEEDLKAIEWTKIDRNPKEGKFGIVRGNGTATVLLLGNSFAYKAIRPLLAALEGRFKEFRIFAKYGCTLLGIENCKEFPQAWRAVVKSMQPDVTFIVSRGHSDKQMPFFRSPINGSIADDEYFQKAQGVIDYLSNQSRFVVLDYQYYEPKGLTDAPANLIEWRLQKGGNIDSFAHELKAPYKDYLSINKWEIARTDALKAPNLVKNRVQRQICSEDPTICYFYNRTSLHAYYADYQDHLTDDALDMLVPGYRRIYSKLLGKLENQRSVEMGERESEKVTNGNKSELK